MRTDRWCSRYLSSLTWPCLYARYNGGSKVSVRLYMLEIKLINPAERESLADMSSVNSYQTFVETEKAGYLIRQWIGSNLYDRVR